MKYLQYFLSVLVFSLVAAAVSITTANYDVTRSNFNNSESLLSTSFVSSGMFHKIGAWTVDGLVFAQPLYVPGVVISGRSRDLLIVATMNDSLYAFDADAPGSQVVWSQLSFATPYANYPTTAAELYGASLGCFSAPVADVANGWIFAVCDTSTPNWVIYKFSLTSGAIISSATISATVTGTGDPGGGDTTSGPNLLFFPRFEFQRTGLALANGNIYFGFSSINDFRPYHGWFMSYRESDLSQQAVFCDSPNGWGGGMWQSGGGSSIDASGNIYVTTGNGTSYDGSTNWTDTAIKFSSTLTMLDWFTPSNNGSIDAVDADVSANRFVLIPGTTLGIVAGKDFNVYLIDTTCMGHLQGSSGCSLQNFKTNASGTPGSGSGSYGIAFGNNSLYLPTTDGSIYGFTFSGSTFNTTPFATQLNSYGFPGPAQMALSCNSGSNCVLWVETAATSAANTAQPGILRALNASTLTEVWNSSTSPRDAIGNLTKYVAPIVTNGRVFAVSQSNQVVGFGLTSTSEATGQMTIRGTATLR